MAVGGPTTARGAESLALYGGTPAAFSPIYFSSPRSVSGTGMATRGATSLSRKKLAMECDEEPDESSD